MVLEGNIKQSWNEAALADISEGVRGNVNAEAAWLIDFAVDATSSQMRFIAGVSAEHIALSDQARLPLPPWRQWPLTESLAATWIGGLDKRFPKHPWVSGQPHLAALIVAPIVNARNHPIGALVVGFTQAQANPKQSREHELAVVGNMARVAAVHLERHTITASPNAASPSESKPPFHASSDAHDSLTAADELLRERLFSDLIIDTLPGAFALLSGDHRLIRWNKELADLTMYGTEDLAAMKIDALIAPRDRSVANQVFSASSAQREAITADLEMLPKLGPSRTFTVRWTPIEILSEPFVLFYGVDSTERQLSQKLVRDARDRLESAIENSEIALWDWDLETNMVYFSSGWKHLAAGNRANEGVLTGQEVVDFNHPDDRDQFVNALTDCVKGVVPVFEVEYRVRTDSGDWVWLYSRGRVSKRDERGYALHLNGSSINITKRKLAEERIEYLATRDALTGLPNRHLLVDRTNQAIAKAVRASGGLAFMFIDLDRFKTINDSLGHHVGDELLKRVSTRLSVCVRATDTVSRLGGDEFAVLIEGLSANEVDSPRLVAEKIKSALNTPVNVDGHMLSTSCSIGVAVYPNDGRDVATLMRNADTAMYHAKDRGRNGFQFFSEEMNAAAQERLAMESFLSQAIRRNELMLYYQPRFDMQTGALRGAEALLRWQHPRRGLLVPPKFIGIAEEIGLIVPIGEWVLERACEQLHAWRKINPQLKVSVNLSVGQIADGDRLFSAVQQSLQWAKLDANALELEITESLIMQNVDEKVQLLNVLGKLGVSLSIDDFGTGYSSLAYLKRLPVDCIKIDGAFVRDIVSDLNDRAIVQAILALADSLDLRTCAEGVETRQQMEALREMGCEEYQGFYAARPLPPEEFEQRFFAENAPASDAI